jgi:hypothetical protein
MGADHVAAMRDTAPMPKPTTPVLMLDFDGVLHPTLADPNAQFRLAPMLADAIRPYQCQIVISSSWRFHVSSQELLTRLPETIAARVIGTTGEAYVGKHARYVEITRWVAQQGGCQWRALDDSHFEFPTPCPQLICCPGGTGVGQAQIDLLVRWLRSPHE